MFADHWTQESEWFAQTQPVLSGYMAFADRKKFRTVFSVALDGSGSPGADSVFVYGGASTTQVQWNAFTEVWDALLRKHDLQYFKSTEAFGWHGEFLKKHAEWGNEREVIRDAVVSEFAALKSCYQIQTTATGFVVGAEGGGPFANSKNVLAKKKELFQAAILNLLRDIPADCGVVLNCDVEKDVEEAFRNWIDSLIRTDSQKVAKIMGIGFYDDKYVYPIQFADLVSGVVRRELEFEKRDSYAPRTALYASLAPGNLTFEPVDSDGNPSGKEIRL